MAKSKGSVWAIYGAAAVWAVYAAVFPLYQIRRFLFAALLSFGAYLLLQAVCPAETAGSAESSQTAPAKPAEEKPENPELEQMVKNGRLAVSEMKRLDGNISDEKISADIRRLETVCQSIFRQVENDPSKLPQIRRFMDYYLPTTLKLLNAYDRMDAAGVSGQNIDATKSRVEDIMSTIVSAFEKQLDSLFGSDAMDISTDISVLETMLAREGLTDAKPKEETSGGTDINLQL